MSKIRVLFFAANPAVTQPLKLDEEIRQITAKVRAAPHRDSLELISRWGVHPNDLLKALLEVKPHIVHFSGLGSSASELILLDDEVVLDYLFRFHPVKDNVRVVVLNACYTRTQAEALAKTVDWIVGTNRAIGDVAAVVFAASFYQTIGFGRSVKEAFEVGRAALLLEGIPEDQMPQLLSRPGVYGELVFIAPPSPEELSAIGPEAKVPGAGPDVPVRLALVRQLSILTPADWSLLVTAIPGAASQVNRYGTVPEQVAELVHWSEGSTGPGLAVVEEAFVELRNPSVGPCPSGRGTAVGQSIFPESVSQSAPMITMEFLGYIYTFATRLAEEPDRISKAVKAFPPTRAFVRAIILASMVAAIVGVALLVRGNPLIGLVSLFLAFTIGVIGTIGKRLRTIVHIEGGER